MFEILYCTQCQVWTIKCPGCGMGGCSGGHIPGCDYAEKELEIDRQLHNLLDKTNLELLLNQTSSS